MNELKLKESIYMYIYTHTPLLSAPTNFMIVEMSEEFRQLAEE